MARKNRKRRTPTKSAQNAERVWQVLTSAAPTGEHPTYEQVAQRLGRKKTLWLVPSLDAIQNYCIANDLPPLTSIVVNKVTGKPSEGYLGHSQDIEAAWTAVKRHGWSATTPNASTFEAHRTRKKRRDWTEPEVTMAAHLYINRGRTVFPNDEEILRLANLLGRTEGAVALKVANIQSVDPDYVAKGGKGMPNTGPLDEPVFRSWRNRPTELRDRFGELVASFGDRDWEEIPAKAKVLPDSWTVQTAEAAIRAGIGLTDTTRRPSFGRDPAKQAKFARGVRAAHWQANGNKPPLECPGCGHARLKANGLPLLVACHIIPWKITGSFDPRWGLPLCPNCHWLSECGSQADQKEILRAAIRRMPQIMTQLQALKAGGALSLDHVERLAALGIKV